MAENHTQPKTITEIIDQIERMREELLIVQNALEEMEPKSLPLPREAVKGI
jgi:division protein CdvB (Snf7/Vps24/ESCRT-III family)